MSIPIRVVSLHRYPVKSMLGEELRHLEVDRRGCVGDRLWSVRTTENKIGSGKDSRRLAAVPGLLELRALEQDGGVAIIFPDGTTTSADASDIAERLSHHVGQPVTLSKETQESHFDDGPVSLIGNASVLAVASERGEEIDPAHFRGNIILDTSEAFVEDHWVGRRLKIGSAVLSVAATLPRCVMIDMKTADLPEQHGNLKAVGRVNNARLGVVATVAVPGAITIGDVVEVS